MLRSYYAKHKSNFYADLVAKERANGVRFVGDSSNKSVRSAFLFLCCTTVLLHYN